MEYPTVRFLRLLTGLLLLGAWLSISAQTNAPDATNTPLREPPNHVELEAGVPVDTNALDHAEPVSPSTPTDSATESASGTTALETNAPPPRIETTNTTRITEPTVVTVEEPPPPPREIEVPVPVVDPQIRQDMQILASRLEAMERLMADQQNKAFEGILASNRTVLIIAALFGTIGFVALVIAGLILARAFNRFSDVALTMPMMHQLGRGPGQHALSDEDPRPAMTQFERSNLRLQSTLEQLERKVQDLERLPRRPAPAQSTSASGNGISSKTQAPREREGTSSGGNGDPGESLAQTELSPEIQRLLHHGENLLNGDQVEEALEYFEQAAALDPANSELLIRRGLVLERLGRLEAAIESYDQAIATNQSVTLAYLHKGAVCNRMQRHREALACYEKALEMEQRVEQIPADQAAGFDIPTAPKA